MVGIGRPISHNRSEVIPLLGSSGKNVQLQIIRLSCIFGLVLASAILFMSYTGSSINEEESVPQILKLQLIPNPGKPSENKLIIPRVISIQGKDPLYTDVNLDGIPDKATVIQLDLHHIQIDPQAFTQSLEPFVNLRTIKLENVKLTSVDWNFKSVYLPNLEEFYVDLSIGFHDQYTDYLKDLTEEKLSKLVFYQKDSTSSLENDLTNKLAQGGVKVAIRADGWTVLSLQASKTEVTSHEAIIAVDFADKLLKRLKEDLDIIHLTMTECSVSKSSFPTRLRYLNLYRVNVSEGDISEALQPMTNLMELFLELRNGTMKMTDIPKSVKTLAISDLDAMYDSGDTSSAENVALGFPMDLDIIGNFDKIFINAKKVAIFEPTNGTQYLLLQRVLKSTADWVYFEGFERTENASRTIVEEEIETLLEGLKVKPNERHALIVRENSTSPWKKQKLNKEEQLHNRYKTLGWDEYITWDVYMNVFLPESIV